MKYLREITDDEVERRFQETKAVRKKEEGEAVKRSLNTASSGYLMKLHDKLHKKTPYHRLPLPKDKSAKADIVDRIGKKFKNYKHYYDYTQKHAKDLEE